MRCTLTTVLFKALKITFIFIVIGTILLALALGVFLNLLMENIIPRKPVPAMKKGKEHSTVDEVIESGLQHYIDKTVPPLPAESSNAAGPTEDTTNTPIAKLIDDSDTHLNDTNAAPGSGLHTTIGSTLNQSISKGHSSRMLPKLSTATEDSHILVYQDVVNDSNEDYSGAHTSTDDTEHRRGPISNIMITDNDPDAMLIAATYLMEESGQSHFGMLAEASNFASGSTDNQYKGKDMKGNKGKAKKLDFEGSNDDASAPEGTPTTSLRVPSNAVSPISQHGSFSPKENNILRKVAKSGSPFGGKEAQVVTTQVRNLEAKETENKAAGKAAQEEKKMNFVAYKVNELRIQTGTQCNYRKWGKGNMMADEFPVQHDRHDREWYDKLLRCNECTNPCARCGIICCAYKQAIKDAADPGKTDTERKTAKLLYDSIDLYLPIGTEGYAFISCDECERKVCPRCAGVCPVFPCFSRCCKDCQPEIWKGCEMHTDKDKVDCLRILKRELKEHYGMVPNSFKGYGPVCERYRKLGE